MPVSSSIRIRYAPIWASYDGEGHNKGVRNLKFESAPDPFDSPREKALTASRLLQKAISLDPSPEECYYLMGRALYDLSRYTDSVDYFRAAIDRDEEYQLAWQQLGVALIRDDNTGKEGIEALHRAVALHPEDPWSLLYLGNALWQDGRIRAALPHYRKAHELYPDDPDFSEWYKEVARRQERDAERGRS